MAILRLGWITYLRFGEPLVLVVADVDAARPDAALRAHGDAPVGVIDRSRMGAAGLRRPESSDGRTDQWFGVSPPARIPVEVFISAASEDGIGTSRGLRRRGRSRPASPPPRSCGAGFSRSPARHRPGCSCARAWPSPRQRYGKAWRSRPAFLHGERPHGTAEPAEASISVARDVVFGPERPWTSASCSVAGD